MADERYSRGNDPQRDYYNRSERQDYGRDYGSGRAYTSSSARNYAAAGQYDRDDDRDDRNRYDRDREQNRGGGRESFGGGYDRENYGRDNYGRQEERGGYRQHEDRGGYGQDRGGYRQDQDRGRSGQYGERSGYGASSYDRDRGDRQGGQSYRGSYASDGHRFIDTDRDDHRDRDRSRDQGRDRDQGRGSMNRQGGYDHDDRGFIARAGDEVRSWFGDEDAERRREMDQRYDEREARQERDASDHHYRGWRQQRMAEFDRDYDEYRRENATRFHSEFNTWRDDRSGQRASLSRVNEHMEVVGSDGAHVGTVDKVRGDQVILTKNDRDAGGHHHSFPSRWIDSVDDKVKLRKSADEAKREWRDAEQGQAMFGDRDRSQNRSSGGMGAGSTGGMSGTSGTGGMSGTGSSGTGSSSSVAGSSGSSTGAMGTMSAANTTSGDSMGEARNLGTDRKD